MGIYNGINQVVRFKSGELWHFFAMKNKGILFRRLGENGAWEDPVELIINTQEDFSVKIDDQDHLHLICRSDTGEIMYMFYNGRNWSKQILSHYEPSRYIIKYPTIILLKSHIHIIFAIGTTFNTGFWSLYHYHWDEQAWHSTEITKLTAGYRLSPFYIDLSEKHIHLVYRGLSSNKYQVFLCRFHIEHGIWSTPENTTHSTSDCNMPSILIKDDKLHLIWTVLSKNDLIVKYKSKPMHYQSKVGWSPELTLSNSGSNAAFPHLIWVEERLWCVWCQTDTLYGCVSEDLGVTWNQAEELNYDNKENFYLINYTTNHPREKAVFKFQCILGNIDNSINLPIVNDYMEIPEYTPSASVTGWMAEAETFKREKEKKANIIEKQNKPLDAGSTTPTEQRTGILPPPERRSYSTQTLENILLKEFERQEEYTYTIISKLDEQSNVNSLILEQNREINTILKENSEKLHNLLLDMEQVKDDIKQFQSRGFLKRLFGNTP